jgi:hypothetical protein
MMIFTLILGIFTLLMTFSTDEYTDTINALCPMPTDTLNSIGLIAGDRVLAHEGLPHGVPESFDWQAKPRIGWGTDMKTANFTAFIFWGQVYEDSAGSTSTNTRVQIRNTRAYVLDKNDGQWYLIQSHESVQGAAYVEDFAGDSNIEANVRDEADGGVSVLMTDGYNFHFWHPDGRTLLDPERVGGVFTTIQARLIVDDPNLPDDRDQARYLMSVGADYWLDLVTGWRADWTANGDVAIGRFRYITSEWNAFNMTTLTPYELCQNPPPLE